jgi:hypothetical protein
MLLPMLPNQRFNFTFIDGDKRSTLNLVQGARLKLASDSKLIVNGVLKYLEKMADFLAMDRAPAAAASSGSNR